MLLYAILLALHGLTCYGQNYDPYSITENPLLNLTSLNLNLLGITRYYSIISYKIPLVFNRYGDHDPNGLIFALKRNQGRLNQIKKSINETLSTKKFADGTFTTYPEIEPLTIRAYVGEDITIKFENTLDRPVGLHLVGYEYGVSSDGSKVGNNPSSLTPAGQKTIYKWKCGAQGAYLFHDAGGLGGFENIATGNTNGHGLFGALICEPVNSIWRNPVTGLLTYTGTSVDIIPPRDPRKPIAPFNGFEAKAFPDADQSFREHVPFFHDEIQVRRFPFPTNWSNPCEVEPVRDATMDTEGLHLINYASEPMDNRNHELFGKYNSGAMDLTRPAVGKYNLF